MPEKDYTKSVIYKITCLDKSIKDIYVGSTLNFNRRKSEHKSSCNQPTCKEYNYYVYQFIRSNGGWENWDMIVIKNFTCNSKRDLITEEDKVMRELNPSLNVRFPIAEKEHIQLYKKEYRKKNKKKIRAYLNEKIVCECGCISSRGSISRHRKSKKHIDLMNKPI